MKLKLTETELKNVIGRITKRIISESRLLTEASDPQSFNRGVYAARFMMKELNLTDYQAAAWAGVCVNENGCRPNNVCTAEKNNKGAAGTRNGGYGAGIGSSTGKSKIKLERQYGMKVEDMDMDMQLKALADHYRRKPYLKYLKSAKTIQEASNVAILMFSGYFKWNRMPTDADAQRVLDFYAKSNARNFGNSGKSRYYTHAYQLRCEAGKKVFQLMRSGSKGSPV